VDGFVRKY